MSLKVAVLFSGLVHAVLLALSPPVGWVPPREILKSLEVSYLPEPPPRPPERKAAVASEAAEVSSRQPRKILKEAVPALQRPTRFPVPRGAGVDSPPLPQKKAEIPSKLSPSPGPEVASVSQVAPKRGVASLPEGAFAELTHKEQVREHLKTKLSYPDFSVAGIVRLSLELGSSGQLREVRLLRASDPRLAQVALNGVRQAVPYPSFPKGMAEGPAQYEFLVQYRQE